MFMNKEEILQQCTIDGNIVRLPNIQLDRKIYMDVAKSLELIGGKWTSGKIKGFVFDSDPSELLPQIITNVDLKKEYQYFATPNDIADKLVELADLKIGDKICEPSAGQGAIVKAIQKLIPGLNNIYGYELMPTNQTFLNKITGFVLLGEDFLTCDTSFDKIIANPPFNNNKDLIHVRKMYECLKPGGRLVSVMSTHWQNNGNKKETEFKEWLSNLNATIIPIEAGAFKESGTLIGILIIIINK